MNIFLRLCCCCCSREGRGEEGRGGWSHYGGEQCEAPVTRDELSRALWRDMFQVFERNSRTFIIVG